MSTPNKPENTDKSGSNEPLKAGAATVVGAAVGGAVAATIGGVGLAVGGTAISIGAAPIIVAGGVVGLAAYGIYRLVGGGGD